MKLIEKSLALLAPHECMQCGIEGSVMCSKCINVHIQPFGERCAGCDVLSPNSKTCSNCRRRKLPSHIWVSAVYAGDASRLVYQYKFDHVRSCGEVMASVMSDAVRDAAIDVDGWVVIPVPSATKRVRERGFDHSKLLARQLAMRLRLPYIDALSRVGQKSQVGASRRVRISQAGNEYLVKSPGAVKGQRILLVDDVITTGATLSACTGILLNSGALSVSAAVFAKKI